MGGEVARADAVAVGSATVERRREKLLEGAGDDEVHAEIRLLRDQDREEEGGEVHVFHAVAVQVDDGGCGEDAQPGEEVQTLQGGTDGVCAHGRGTLALQAEFEEIAA